MKVSVELDKLDDDGFKKPANSVNADSPDNITHARMYYNDFAGSNYVQGDFVEGSNSTAYFTIVDLSYSLFKLYTSTNGTDYTERKSFGGDDGVTLIDDTQILDPEDFTDDAPYIKAAGATGSRYFTGGTGGGTTSSGGVDYFYCRGILTQHNDVQSGRAFFGATTINPDDGTVEASLISPIVTIAAKYNRLTSARLSTGTFSLQFQTDYGSGYEDGFITELSGGIFKQNFESQVYTVFNIRSVEIVEDFYTAIYTPGVKGYLVLDVFHGSGNFYTDGILIIKTYNSNWELEDNIIEIGTTIEFRANSIIAI